MKYVILLLICLLPSPVRAGDSSTTDDGRPAEPVQTIVFGSCIRQRDPVPIFETMVSQDPDLCILLGDNIYADTEDLEKMRADYALLGAMPGFVRMREACPILATWDDHDYGVNDGGADYPQRSGSQQIFLDFWGVPEDSPRRQREGIYHAWHFGPSGRRVQVILLDCRYFRSPLKRGSRRVGGSWVPDDDPARTMLGEQQWKWLEEQLRQPAAMRIIGSGIQVLASDAGQETWANLPRERSRLLELIDSTGAEGVLFLSGDRHWSELSRLDEGVPYPLYDLTSSSFNQVHPRGTPTENRHRLLPQTYHLPNFGRVSIDWAAADPQITLQIRDLDDHVQLEHVIPLSTLQR